MQTQLDQLLSSVVPSGAATGVPSSPAPDAPAVTDTSDPLFRIPASTEVPVKGVHAAPPPARNIQKKLDEAGWKRLAEQVQAAQNVHCPKSICSHYRLWNWKTLNYPGQTLLIDMSALTFRA